MADTPNLINATSNLPQVLVAQQLSVTAESSIYEVPASKSAVIDTATVCNTHGAAQTAYLSVVKAGGTSGSANRVAIITLEPGESTVVDELVGCLGPGDLVAGHASAAGAVAIVLRGAVSS
jgi:hypothetical protein